MNNKNLVFRGKSVRQDHLGRMAIIDKKTGNAYQLTKENVRLYNVLESRWIYSLILFYFIGVFFKNYLVATCTGLIVLMLSEWYYRHYFLKSLPVMKKFEPVNQQSSVKLFIQNYTKGRIAAFCVLAALMTPTFVLNAIYSKYSGTELMFNYVLSALCGCFTLFLLYCLFLKIKEK